MDIQRGKYVHKKVWTKKYYLLYEKGEGCQWLTKNSHLPEWSREEKKNKRGEGLDIKKWFLLLL